MPILLAAVAHVAPALIAAFTTLGALFHMVPGGGKGGGKGDKKGKKPSGRWIKVGYQLYETSGTDNNTYDSESEEEVSTVASSTSLEAQGLGAKSKAKARKAARLAEGPPTQSSASSSWDVSSQCAVNPGGGASSRDVSGQCAVNPGGGGSLRALSRGAPPGALGQEGWDHGGAARPVPLRRVQAVVLSAVPRHRPGGQVL